MKCSHGVSIPCPLMLAFTSSTKHLTIFGRLSWTAHSSGGKPRMSTPSRLAPACSTTSHDVDVAAQSCYTKRGPVLCVLNFDICTASFDLTLTSDFIEATHA
mmetsp:Transcript_33972/g.57582  ORF Transcript_33972/g.57582 Transcript_33972/m.57582 type:complete len:102 (-) Transcript_33972:867-1172(-)